MTQGEHCSVAASDYSAIAAAGATGGSSLPAAVAAIPLAGTVVAGIVADIYILSLDAQAWDELLNLWDEQEDAEWLETTMKLKAERKKRTAAPAPAPAPAPPPMALPSPVAPVEEPDADIGRALAILYEEDDNNEYVTLYRGTSIPMENWIYAETGHLLSEAGIEGFGYYGAKSIVSAYTFAAQTHLTWSSFWGNELAYAQAHTELGRNLSADFGLPRTFLSTTTDPAVARHFAGPAGVVYSARVPRKLLEQVALPGSPCESEWLLRFGSGPIIFTPTPR